MKRVLEVKSSIGESYPVFLGGTAKDFIETVWNTQWKRAVVIGDANTLPILGHEVASILAGRGVAPLTLSFPAGEQFKTRETKARLEDSMLASGIDRGACVIGVGGGIALDVAGFVASTYMRGLPFISIATSLLAQVDASIGGKTGVNTEFGKNLIGTFHSPRAVWLATHALKTLPIDELRNGWAEAVKHAVIADEQLFSSIEVWARNVSTPFPEDLMTRCLTIKSIIVGCDEFEEGRRKVLNFGHTVGHALERASNHSLSHGRAVAIGMVVEALAAQSRCGFPQNDVQRLMHLLDALRLCEWKPLAFDDVASHFSLDKKSRNGVIYCALPRRIGEMDAAEGRYALAVSVDELRDAWGQLIGGVS